MYPDTNFAVVHLSMYSHWIWAKNLECVSTAVVLMCNDSVYNCILISKPHCILIAWSCGPRPKHYMQLVIQAEWLV